MVYFFMKKSVTRAKIALDLHQWKESEFDKKIVHKGIEVKEITIMVGTVNKLMHAE